MRNMQGNTLSQEPTVKPYTRGDVSPPEFPPVLIGQGTIGEYWVQFILGLLGRQSAVYIDPAGRKFLQNQTLSIPGDAWQQGFPLTFADLGYSAEGSKLGQLSRIYLNPQYVEAARAKWKERLAQGKDYTSLVIPMQNQAKRAESQGYCMAHLVISHAVTPLHHRPKHSVTITLSYRVTEAIVKFGADLIFLHRVVIPMLLEGMGVDFYLDSVNFHFASVFVSPMFIPALYGIVGPIPLLTYLEANLPFEPGGDGSLIYRTCYGVFRRWWRARTKSYKYATRQRMHNLAQKALDQGFVDPLAVDTYIERKERERCVSTKTSPKR